MPLKKGSRSQRERRERLALLARIDAKYRAPKDAEGLVLGGHPELSIDRPDRFAALAALPVAQLVRILQKGSALTVEEERTSQRRYSADLKVIAALENTAPYRAAWSALDTAKEKPAEAAEAFDAHLTQLLDLGSRVEHVEELQVGYLSLLRRLYEFLSELLVRLQSRPRNRSGT